MIDHLTTMSSPETPPKTHSSQVSEDADSKIEAPSNPDGTSSSSGGAMGADEPCCSRGETGVHQAVVVDMGMASEEHLEVEKVCRICHLSNEQSSSGGGSELIQLGCNCREELGLSHRHCAEAWFKQKGNRVCEICNRPAKNVRYIKDPRAFVMEINEVRPMEVRSTSPPFEPPRGGGSRWCKQSCNFILACLVLAFLTSTFLRVKLF